MIMKTLIGILILLFVSACSLFQTGDKRITEPDLIKQALLPDIPQALQNQDIRFSCEMIVDIEGNVEAAKIIESSGDKSWDSLITISLMNWKYSPALVNGKPVKYLLRRKVNVLFAEARSINLAQIICSNSTDADSAYNKLLSGEDFAETARKFSISPDKNNGGVVGEVDVQHYSDHISRVISKLKINEFSKPVEYGINFAIFKRLKD